MVTNVQEQENIHVQTYVGHRTTPGQPQDCCSEEQGWFWSEPSTFWEDWHVSLESLLHSFTHCWRTLLAMTPSDPDSFTGICWSHDGAHTCHTENWLFQTGRTSRSNQQVEPVLLRNWEHQKNELIIAVVL